MYFNSLEQLSNKYKKSNYTSDDKRELERGLEKLNSWLVSIQPRYRSNINVVDFTSSETVRVDVALRIFDDSSKLGMFGYKYRYRDVDGTVICSSENKKEILRYFEDGYTDIEFVPGMIEKSYILKESTNENFNSVSNVFHKIKTNDEDFLNESMAKKASASSSLYTVEDLEGF